MVARKPKPKVKGASLADIPYVGTTPSAAGRRADVARQRRYDAEEALRTLTRAEEHRSNPKLMAEVKKIAAEQASKMSKIAGK